MSLILAGLRLLFELQSSSFATVRHKVVYTLSSADRLTSGDWLSGRNEYCSSFDKFAEKLTSIFNPSAHLRVIAVRLFRLSHCALSVIDYTFEFRTLAIMKNWKEEMLCNKCYQGLTDSIKTELAGHTLPKVATGQCFKE